MRHSLKVTALAIAFVPLLGVIPTAADAAPAVAHLPLTARTKTAPAVDIIASGARVATFDPKKVTAGTVAKGACSAADYSFSVSNRTSVQQQLTYMGSDFEPAIPPHGSVNVCALASGKAVLSLVSNRSASLHVDIVD